MAMALARMNTDRLRITIGVVGLTIALALLTAGLVVGMQSRSSDERLAVVETEVAQLKQRDQDQVLLERGVAIAVFAHLAVTLLGLKKKGR